MSDALSPAQSIACNFWVEFNSGSPLALYFVDRLREISGRYTQDDLDDYCDEVEQLLATVGYPATVDVLNDTYPIAQAQRQDFWAGVYTLRDAGGQAYRLQIDVDSARLSNGTSASEQVSFQDGTLTFTGDDISGTLQLSAPTDAGAELRSSVQPLCSGTIQLGKADQAKQWQVTGRRGCYLPASIGAAADGDPLDFWAGTYAVRLTSGDSPFWLKDSLQVSSDAGKPVVKFGARVPSQVQYVNNALICQLDANNQSRLALQFHCDADGNAGCIGAFIDTDGQLRALEGFKLPAASMPAPRFRALVAGGVLNRTGGVVTFQIDMRNVANVPSYELPMGVERNPYNLTIELTQGATAYAWTLDMTNSAYRDILDLQVDATDSRKARLVGAFGETQHAGKELFRITVTPSGLSAINLDMKLLVQSRNPISISTNLPPITRTRKYQTALVATGGEPPYTWTLDGSKLPPGLTFDRTTNAIEGTVSDLDTSQNAYGVAVQVDSANTILMSPGNDILSFHIDEPEQTGTAVTGWFSFLFEVLGAGGALLVLGQWIKSRVKRQQQGKPDDPVEELKTMMEKSLDTLTTTVDKLAAPQRSTAILDEIKAAVEESDKAKQAYQDMSDLAKSRKAYWDKQATAFSTKVATLNAQINEAKAKDQKDRLKADKKLLEDQQAAAEKSAAGAEADRKKFDKEGERYAERVDRMRGVKK